MKSTRLALCVLVLVNLLQVHSTGMVGASWILVLSAMTLSAPLTSGANEHWTFRWLWNVAVICLFVVLARRTMVEGVEHMLEGGLLLAAICQVHLVNHVSRRQRPDLLLFNSFLIALVTGFFSQEVTYMVLFLVYALTLTVTWRLSAVARTGVAARPSEKRLRLAARSGLAQGIATLAVTAAAFVLMPRDFERPGFVSAHLVELAAVAAGVDLDDRVPLERRTVLPGSDREAMRVRPLDGGEVPTLWRTATYTTCDAEGWHAERSTQSQPDRLRQRPWSERGDGDWVRADDDLLASARRFHVELVQQAPQRLPLPDHAVAMRLIGRARRAIHLPMQDGTFALFERGDGHDLAYEVATPSEHARPGGRPPGRLMRRRLLPWLQIDAETLPLEATTLAQTLRQAVPADADQHRLVETLRLHLQGSFEYRLPGQPGAGVDLRTFFERRAGHCELFASALALMLRQVGVPTRLATGFLVAESGDDGVAVVREKHAHAWVEVFDPDIGWYPVDATPAPPDIADDGSWWNLARAAVERWWGQVLGFGASSQRELLTHGGWMLGSLVAAVAVILVLRQRRRAAGDPQAVRRYLRAQRRARLPRAPWETPRALLRRAAASGVPADRGRQLLEATLAHEAARYRRAGPPPGG